MDDVMDMDTAIKDSFPAISDDIEDDSEDTDTEQKTTEEDDEKSGGKEGKEEEEGGKEDEEDSKEGDEKKEGDDDKEKKDEPADKKKNRAQKRSFSLRKEIESLARERNAIRAEIEEMSRQKDSKEPELPPEPKPEQFQNQRDYDFAMGKYQSDVANIEARNQEREQRRIESEFREYNQRIKAEIEAREDGSDALRSFKSFFPDGNIPSGFHNAFIQLDNPGDVVYFLGKNSRHMEDVLRIRNPYRQSMKLAEIGLKIKSAIEAGKKKKSGAPPPPAKVKGGSGGAQRKDPSKMSAEEYAIYKGYKTKLKGS